MEPKECGLLYPLASMNRRQPAPKPGDQIAVVLEEKNLGLVEVLLPIGGNGCHFAQAVSSDRLYYAAFLADERVGYGW